MKLLVGSTGLIGTTLRDTLTFDHEYNSKNLQDLLLLPQTDNPLDLYLSCLPATKWKVNQEPVKDLLSILSILDIISKHTYNTVVLYSTIDIYSRAPGRSNEKYEPIVTELNYGNNRYLFENLVKNTLRYQKLVIIRLPALFGKHIKKNVLYDLLNKNLVEKINYNSTYQWYNLDNLALDTDKCIKVTENQSYNNLFTEPISTPEILKLFNVQKKDVDTSSNYIEYDYTTEKTRTGYIDSADNTYSQIIAFIHKYQQQETL